MSRSIRRALVLAAATAVAVPLLNGCGGDTRRAEIGGATTTTTQAVAPPAGGEAGGARPPQIATPATPARRAYVAQVDRVCSRLDPERNAARRRAGEAADVAGTVKAYDDTIAVGQRQLRRIEAIKPPPGDAKLLKANVFDVIRQQLATRRRLSAALAANQPLSQIQSLRAHLDSLTTTLIGFARGYGFRTCGED